MASRYESDDALAVYTNCNRSLIPKRTALPTEKEIDDKIKTWLNDEILTGNDPNDMELSDVVEVRKCIYKLSYNNAQSLKFKRKHIILADARMLLYSTYTVQ